ncbi:hypothetical protein [uncultured Desulfobacter sp.]|uniref:hypothetical protein n=1 Tax=uncultured Desulfobacter sp. TaxID=240139 RepID=UPI0029F5B9A2|nr:hypothetical protein [uncultured Desulfobacter sp.]
MGLYDLENYFYDSVTGTTDNPGEFAAYQYADHQVATEATSQVLATTSLGSAAALGVVGSVSAVAMFGPEITTGALYTYNFISQNQMIAYEMIAGAMPGWPNNNLPSYTGWGIGNIVEWFKNNEGEDPCSR